MSAKPGKKNSPVEEKKNAFLHQFSRESQPIRDAITRDIPGYNVLLSTGAASFEETALRMLAAERGIPYQKGNPPMPVCPHCKQYDKVGTKGAEDYFCNRCQRKFTATHNAIVSGTKCDALTWMKVLLCLLNFTPITQACEQCGISETTFYKIRARLFYAMQLFMNEVRLYGVVEVDNCFVRISYKGLDLAEREFAEDSMFFDDGFKPRESRKRGGAYAIDERNANCLCIFCGIDDRGHVLTRFAGVGITSLRMLQSYVPEDKILSTVPKKDSFCYMPKKKRTPEAKPGAKTLIVSDKEKAIEKYANSLGIVNESHVYRKDGVQRRLPKDAHSIQHVNALHHRLRTMLRRTGYVSSKWLPGYLILFEFLENTGGSQAAISRLFQILTTPGLGRSPSFYKEHFVVPNYLQIWFSEGPVALRKLPYNKLLAFYLYDHIREKAKYPDSDITMDYIVYKCGYSAPTVRSSYRNLCDAGYRESILHFFGEPTDTDEKANKKKPTKAPKADVPAPKTINPIVLEIYDEYTRIRLLPKKGRPSLDALLKEKNAQYGTSYTRTNMLEKFRYIEEKGIRDKRPPMPARKPNVCSVDISEKVLSVFRDYNALVLSYREKGQKLPVRERLYEEIGQKYQLAPKTVQGYVVAARSYVKTQKK